MATTIIPMFRSNEGPDGVTHSGTGFLARKETPQEEAQTAAFARAAFRLRGCAPCACRVHFYGGGTHAVVNLSGHGPTMVKESDL